MKNSEFVEYIKEILEAVTEVKIRSMFGGYGVYKGQSMIGLIADSELYFKANTIAAEYFESKESKQFMYMRQGKYIKMSYWQVLPEVLEDREPLNDWYCLAINSTIKPQKTEKR